MTIPGGHLKRGMTQHTAESVKVAPILDPPGCERVSQIVETKIRNARPATGSQERLLRIADPGAVRLAEQIARAWTRALLQKLFDRLHGPRGERDPSRAAGLGDLQVQFATAEVD